MILTFDELREIKHSLPTGSVAVIANEFGLSKQTVRNYFGGTDFERGESSGIHIEPGPNGGIVNIRNTAILERAKAIIDEARKQDVYEREF